uniref:Uncharacterized protein n=1 Tax=Cryptomonas curvata TaxID=233186 RepID=A0A7S0QSG8_9CRYP|mmetsp:Transcript_49762/g.103810  ORF Transcript_49762/g.103810 Transcript_49762/m.103810 type:complete len:112 (+) Transcript_49762:347-682(+)
MGYTPEGHQLPIPTWNPGIKSNAFPNWIKADGIKAPKCFHDINFVYATGNDVTPFIGFEKWEDIGISVRFFLPYVYINQEKKWFRYFSDCLFMWSVFDYVNRVALMPVRKD